MALKNEPVTSATRSDSLATAKAARKLGTTTTIVRERPRAAKPPVSHAAVSVDSDRRAWRAAQSYKEPENDDRQKVFRIRAVVRCCFDSKY